MLRGFRLRAFFERQGCFVDHVGADSANGGYILRIFDLSNGRRTLLVTYYIDADGLIAPYAIYAAMDHLPMPLACALSEFVEKLHYVPGYFSQWQAGRA